MTREQAYGDAITERLGSVKLDSRANGAAREFKAKHKAYAAAHAKAVLSDEARASALAKVGAADEVLDTAVNRLADVLIGAGLRTRRAPFDGISALSPAEVCKLGYAAELKEVAKLTRNARKLKPPKTVLAVCDAIDAAAKKAGSLLSAYDAAQKEAGKASAARDAIAPEWQKSLSRLRVLARASLIDEPGSYEALFAEPTLSVPRRRRSTKKTPTPPTE